MSIEKGKAVEVVKGRKVAIGTKGIVRWFGSTRFGYRVGLAVEGQTELVYTSLDNVRLDESPEAAARELDAAHDTAFWIDQKRSERITGTESAREQLGSVTIAVGDKVTPKSGLYAAQKCRVIWLGPKPEGVKVGVVPVARPVWSRYERRMVFPKFTADWLLVSEVAA
jgi:hypothetical protein